MKYQLKVKDDSYQMIDHIYEFMVHGTIEKSKWCPKTISVIGQKLLVHKKDENYLRPFCFAPLFDESNKICGS